MEMDRLNENTIRVILSTEDLQERGVTVLDLLGNKKQIESFFYSILDEVDKDHVFTNNEPVTFQIMPNKAGLELLISKSDDSEDTDSLPLNGLQGSVVNNNDDTNEAKMGTEEYDSDTAPYLNDPDTPTKTVIVEFKDFEDYVQLADLLHLESGISNLWEYDNKYYLQLILFTDEMHEMTYSDVLALLSEYSFKTKVTAAVLSEYGKEIMSKTALELTRYYFDKK
ncbi:MULTISPECIES: adaptor protein MecA [Companilactobacillus]|uniref:Adapter protein MecA n=4 Tax=Companilactobacillus TaxID=2767879 RepID=A0ABR5NV48_9LACO|nr:MULTISPECIES: adaptor protein MecA [Companilactobacillus]GEO47256.1 adapter protein MecA [Companilactobacillus paralimentarius]KAE9561761.1 adaptor protein MecA [Companilactobacillus bobalius]KAE9563182.1 adaptor protein MecA [Companilactobacillus kimchii]KRK52703.1 adaptor protein [Companilactobacillus kimchii DSM 13961 = JCM 10707]KRK82679.1 adaptor protein [Companilactobacillus bobalius DSM 19674]